MKLTDEQIKLVCRTGMWDDSWQSVQFARAIEAEVLRLNGVGGEAFPYSGADETPPVFGRRWSTHPDGFGFKRNDVDGNYVHIDDALSVLHQWQEEAERKAINFCNACSAALAVPQPQQAEPGAVLEGWQPIETAPTDGTEFLGYRGGRIGNACRIPRHDCEMWEFRGTSGAFNIAPYLKPTHWMPLPAAPKDQP